MINKSAHKRFSYRLIRLFVAGMGLLGATATLAGGPDHVEMLANMCAVCHGTGGKGADRIPKLNGELKAEKFIDTMHGFISGDEAATVMDHIGKGLTEDEITALAKYFAALEQ